MFRACGDACRGDAWQRGEGWRSVACRKVATTRPGPGAVRANTRSHALHASAWLCMALHGTTALHCMAAPHCTALHCTALWDHLLSHAGSCTEGDCAAGNCYQMHTHGALARPSGVSESLAGVSCALHLKLPGHQTAAREGLTEARRHCPAAHDTHAADIHTVLLHRTALHLYCPVCCRPCPHWPPPPPAPPTTTLHTNWPAHPPGSLSHYHAQGPAAYP